jgi:hypothetical protein
VVPAFTKTSKQNIILNGIITQKTVISYSTLLITGSYSLSSGQDFITTDQLQRRMRTVEKNTDKQGEPGHVLSDENEQKQEGDSDLSAGREGGNQQVMNKMAEEGNEGEDGFVKV